MSSFKSHLFPCTPTIQLQYGTHKEHGTGKNAEQCGRVGSMSNVFMLKGLAIPETNYKCASTLYA